MKTNHRLFASLLLCLCIGSSAPFGGVATIPRHEGRTEVPVAIISGVATSQPPHYGRQRRASSALFVASFTSSTVILPIDNTRKICQHPHHGNAIIDEATVWQLLNGTNVGEMNRSQFEEAETIVQAWSKRQSKRAAIVVEQLLRRIIEEQMAENPYADCVDMTALYANLIDGWANCGEEGGAERAEEILDYFQRISEEGDSYDPLLCGPGIRSFHAVIGAYARSGREDAPQQAIRVLGKLYDLNREGRTSVAPNVETYARTSTVIILTSNLLRSIGMYLLSLLLNSFEF